MSSKVAKAREEYYSGKISADQYIKALEKESKLGQSRKEIMKGAKKIAKGRAA